MRRMTRLVLIGLTTLGLLASGTTAASAGAVGQTSRLACPSSLAQASVATDYSGCDATQIEALLVQAAATTDSPTQGPGDPRICPILVTLYQLTGGSIGPFILHADGDVYLVVFPPLIAVLIYDCPPYVS